MAGNYTNRADPFFHKDDDRGFQIGWKLKYDFQRGHLDGEMTYGEARKKAAELQEKEPEKVFWPEVIMDPNF